MAQHRASEATIARDLTTTSISVSQDRNSDTQQLLRCTSMPQLQLLDHEGKPHTHPHQRGHLPSPNTLWSLREESENADLHRRTTLQNPQPAPWKLCRYILVCFRQTPVIKAFLMLTNPFFSPNTNAHFRRPGPDQSSGRH